jgi:ABC-type transport system involved in multi-copper enzyme maturation permease subunit
MGSWWAELPGRVFGPMFALDAVRAGRRNSTFLVRGLFLVGLAIVLFMFFSAYYRRFQGRALVNPKVLADFAEEFFWVYAVTQFVIACALTPAFTAAAITDEKERKTLDFLLVTDMSAREIVFGKLGARVGILFTFVLAGLPILSLIQFFGGIDPRFVLIAAAMTLVTIVSLSALGIACSVALPRTREAVVLAYALPVAYLFVSRWWWWNAVVRPTVFTGGPGTATSPWADVANVFVAGNPFVVVPAIGRGSATTAFATDSATAIAIEYVVFHGIVALLGIAFAALRLRSVARKSGAVARKPRGRASRLFAWLIGKRTEARKHKPVGDDPVYWREVHVDPGSGSGVLRRLLAVGVVCAVVFPFLSIVADTLLWPPSYRRTWGGQLDPVKDFQERTKVWACVVTGALGMLMLLRAAVRGAASVAGEKDRDTWTGLIGTPLTTNEILGGKWYGCILGQWDALCLLAAVWTVGLLTFSVNLVGVALSAGTLAVYLAAFSWLGICCSVTARNTRVAIARAIPLALLMGGGFWIVPGCFGSCLAIVGGRGISELLGYGAAFLFGFTPPAMLGGLSALDAELLRDMNRGSRGTATFTTLVCGAVFGTGTWVWITLALRLKATALFDKEANRNPGRRGFDPDDWDDGPRLRRPTREPRREDPSGSWGTGGTS